MKYQHSRSADFWQKQTESFVESRVKRKQTESVKPGAPTGKAALRKGCGWNVPHQQSTAGCDKLRSPPQTASNTER
jgi:hypothetical protein